ncbi:MAG: Cof-type HAD-IIB family hydrolase [Bacteroidales bacterium]|nr:Cof-type HAD-IIB family hydrolase [Bacteroidales bacterium]
MIKALFFDIDGTLVGFDTHRMSANLKDCLMELRAKGVKLFISSGRHVLVMNNLDGFPFDGYIAMNGALTILGGEVIDQHPLPRETALRIAGIAREYNVPCWSFADNVCGINFENELTREVSGQLNFYPENFLDLEKVASERIVYQYTIYMDTEKEERILHPVLDGVDYPRWHPYFVDIVSRGLSKSRGASLILGRLGLSTEECMAFGDGGNDIPLLRYAGVGVAMGNAPDDVKAAADYVTDPVEEDGVISALRRFGVV